MYAFESTGTDNTYLSISSSSSRFLVSFSDNCVHAWQCVTLVNILSHICILQCVLLLQYVQWTDVWIRAWEWHYGLLLQKALEHRLVSCHNMCSWQLTRPPAVAWQPWPLPAASSAPFSPPPAPAAGDWTQGCDGSPLPSTDAHTLSTVRETPCYIYMVYNVSHIKSVPYKEIIPQTCVHTLTAQYNVYCITWKYLK